MNLGSALANMGRYEEAVKELTGLLNVSDIEWVGGNIAKAHELLAMIHVPITDHMRAHACMPSMCTSCVLLVCACLHAISAKHTS